MEKICCFLGKVDRGYIIADLSNVFRNNPVPSINEEYRQDWEYPFDKELEIGQLFLFSECLSPGKMNLKIEPMNIDEYESMIGLYRLFANSGNTYLYSNSLKNKVLNLLEKYYDRVVLNEIRDKKINIVLDEKN